MTGSGRGEPDPVDLEGRPDRAQTRKGDPGGVPTPVGGLGREIRAAVRSGSMEGNLVGETPCPPGGRVGGDLRPPGGRTASPGIAIPFGDQDVTGVRPAHRAGSPGAGIQEASAGTAGPREEVVRSNHKARMDRLIARHPDAVCTDGAMHRRDQVLVPAEQAEAAGAAGSSYVERVERFADIDVHRIRLRSDARVNVPEFAAQL